MISVNKLIYKLNKLITKTFGLKNNPLPQYYWISERDCDYMLTEHATKFSNGRKAQRYKIHLYENREGPVYINQLTRDEYLEYQYVTIRDDIAARHANY